MKKLLILTLACVGVSAHAVTLISTQSAYVQSGASANSNFGSSPDLLVKNMNVTGDWNRKSYIGFDLSAYAGIADASFRIRTNGYLGTYTGGVHTFNVFGQAGSSWGEGTINWNNAPGNSGAGFATLNAPMALLGTFTVSSAQVSNTDIDFTSAALVDLLDQNAGGSVTLAIARLTPETSGNTIVHRFFSDDTDNGPELSLTPVPEPASLGALFAGGIAFLRRRRR